LGNFQQVAFEGRIYDTIPRINNRFSGERVDTKGYVDLQTTFGRGSAIKTIKFKCFVVDACTSYNALLVRYSLNKLGAIMSTHKKNT